MIITMHLLIVIIVLALATHRITRFITRDKFPPMALRRERYIKRWGVWDAPEEMRGQPIDPRGTTDFKKAIAYLWECDWCMSIWIGGILTLITSQVTSLPLPWLIWLAISSITGLIAQSEPD